MPALPIAFNLDNLRCLLYGYGRHETPDPEHRYAVPAGRTAAGMPLQEPIRDRRVFLQVHFGPGVDGLLQRSLQVLEDKKQTEFLTEISTHRGSRRGQGSFLEETASQFAAGGPGFQLGALIQRNEELLQTWDLAALDEKLANFLGEMLTLEREGTAADPKAGMVSYVLEQICREARDNAGTAPDLLCSARTLSLTLLAALLMEKFPLPVLTSSPAPLPEQRYHLENLLEGLQINLTVLRFQLQPWQDFLLELMQQPGADRAAWLEEKRAHGEILLWNAHRLTLQLDYTDLTGEWRLAGIPLRWSAVSFLHSVAFHLQDFAAGWIPAALDMAEQAPDCLRERARAMLDALSLLEWLVHWYLYLLCHDLPSEVLCNMPELQRWMRYLAVLGAPQQMDLRRIQEEIRTGKQYFLNDLFRSQIGWRQPFSQLDFPEQLQLPKPPKPPCVLCEAAGHTPEEAVLAAFMIPFRRMDRICGLQGLVLALLSNAAECAKPLPAEENSWLQDGLERYRALLLAETDRPQFAVEEPLYSCLQAKGIKTLAFQSLCSYRSDIALTSLRRLEELQGADGGEGLQLAVQRARVELDGHIQTCNALFLSLFGDWDPRWKPLAEAAAECSVLQAGPGQTGERPDRDDRSLSSLLDAFEGDLHCAEKSREI